MTAEIVTLNVETTLPISADRVLEAAVGKLETVLVLGYQPDGTQYFAGSHADKGEMLLLIERFKKRLLGGEPDFFD